MINFIEQMYRELGFIQICIFVLIINSVIGNPLRFVYRIIKALLNEFFSFVSVMIPTLMYTVCFKAMGAPFWAAFGIGMILNIGLKIAQKLEPEWSEEEAREDLFEQWRQKNA